MPSQPQRFRRKHASSRQTAVQTKRDKHRLSYDVPMGQPPFVMLHQRSSAQPRESSHASPKSRLKRRLQPRLAAPRFFPRNFLPQSAYITIVIKFLLWMILFVMCWPLALAALLLFPLIWVLLLPFRIVGIAVGGALGADLGRSHTARPGPPPHIIADGLE